MDFFDLVQTRHSVRNYDPQKTVELDVLKRVLNAGRLAPSAVNRQPWRFWLYSSQPMLNRVKECYPRSWFNDAPHILVIIGQIREAWIRQADQYCSIETDLAIAMDHIILAATAEGVGTCWIEAYDPTKLKEVLELTEDQCVYSITPLGYPKDDYQKPAGKKRKSFEEIVNFI